MENFYITLPYKKLKENSINKLEYYVTELPHNFDLKGNWNVGLSEISYTKSWNNIPRNQKIELIYYNGTNEDNIGISYFDSSIFKAGDYDNDSLVKEINSIIGKHFELLTNER